MTYPGRNIFPECQFRVRICLRVPESEGIAQFPDDLQCLRAKFFMEHLTSNR